MHLVDLGRRVVVNEIDAHRSRHSGVLARCAAHGNRFDVVGGLGLDFKRLRKEFHRLRAIVRQRCRRVRADAVDCNAKAHARVGAVGAGNAEIANSRLFLSLHAQRLQGARGGRHVLQLGRDRALDFVDARAARKAHRAPGDAGGDHKRLHLVGGLRLHRDVRARRTVNGEIRNVDLRAGTRLTAGNGIGNSARNPRRLAAVGDRPRKAPELAFVFDREVGLGECVKLKLLRRAVRGVHHPVDRHGAAQCKASGNGRIGCGRPGRGLVHAVHVKCAGGKAAFLYLGLGVVVGVHHDDGCACGRPRVAQGDADVARHVHGRSGIARLDGRVVGRNVKLLGRRLGRLIDVAHDD